MERDERRLVRHAKKRATQRKKPWSAIAREIGIEASAKAINNAFIRAGFGRHKKRYKPPLIPEQRQNRRIFCEEWLDVLKGKEHLIIYCDETPVKVGDTRGQEWVTRKAGEEYHPDCVGARFKKYSDLMFWAGYTASEIGPCYMFDKESNDERETAQIQLDFFFFLKKKKANYCIQERFLKLQFDQEQLRKPPNQSRTREPKSDAT